MKSNNPKLKKVNELEIQLKKSVNELEMMKSDFINAVDTSQGIQNYRNK
jgi:hypothetical protein